MSKITLKSVQERYAKLLTATRAYAVAVRNPQVKIHSTSPVTITNSEGQPKGRAIVSIEELVATAKAGEILGFDTRIVVADGGKGLRVEFVQSSRSIPLPDAMVYGG